MEHSEVRKIKTPCFRRRLLFGSLAITLSLFLILISYIWLHSRFPIAEWPDYEMMNKDLEANLLIEDRQIVPEDLLLQIPGLTIQSRLSGKNQYGNWLIFHGGVNGQISYNPLIHIESFWREKGLVLENLGDVIIGGTEPETTYMAFLSMDNTGDVSSLSVTIGRFSAHDEDTSLIGFQKKSHGSSHFDLLPNIPENAILTETGTRYAPGYSLLLSFRCPPKMVFQEVCRDLDERGWRNFEKDVENSKIYFQDMSINPYASEWKGVFFHEKLNLGCLVMVQSHSELIEGTRMFISLF